MEKKIFIDGSAGTTGLRIRERLQGRRDISLLTLPDELRKDVNARRDALNSADVAFLCLPDAAAIEAVALVENPSTVVIDTSTAHRTNPAWEYGFPELSGRRERIVRAKRIANPGCHASGFIALVEPLVRNSIVSPSAPLAAFSLTGYSGGGKKMIAEYEEQGSKAKDQGSSNEGQGSRVKGQVLSDKVQETSDTASSPLSLDPCPLTLYLGGRQYALGQQHKHLPEMVKVCGLDKPPVFSPIIVPHLSGMETTVMLQGADVKGGVAAIADCYSRYYAGAGLVRYAAAETLPQVISSAMMSGRDDMIVTVHGNDERIVVTAVFDNLGKGASGAAIQNMNLALGVAESEGLVCEG